MFGGTVTNVDFARVPRPVFLKASATGPTAPTPKESKASARYARAAKLASEVLPEIPEYGTSVHYLLLGTFDWMQVVTAVTDRLHGCSGLTIASLCYSKRNAVEILGLLERHPDLRFVMLISAFFV